MIPRYSRPDMTQIFDADNKFRIMLDIEILAAEAMEQNGTIPQGVAKAIRERGKFDTKRIEEIEREVKHDVIAFLTNIAEHVGDEARYMHQGLTSSDILDTTLAVQLTQACDILLHDVDSVLTALKKRAIEHQNTLCIGRSHGIHAEPTTFGIKLAGHHAAFQRAKERLEFARKHIATCSLSGAVGTYATVDPLVEAYVADKLGLNIETVATQVIPRDRHAFLASVMGVIASSIENLAVEIRHLQRTEVREAEEFFSKGQKGSSAMPHKRNPVLSENLTGLARIVRSAVTPALENVALWHERDISHSAVERTILPDAFIALDFALARLANVIENLLVYPVRMKKNLEATGGLVFSQRLLLALTQNGMSREDAYAHVQRHAMAVWESDGVKNLREEILSDPTLGALLKDKADEIFDYNAYTSRAAVIVKRAVGE
jgi:adenylosuccinate lyase